jgi:two-component system, NarL family, response regulator NreC
VIRILVADDHAVLRGGVAALIGAQHDLQVVAEAADADSAVALSREHSPDVAIVDLGMPGGGIGCIERIVRSCPRVRAIAFTMHDDANYVRAVLAAGGSGYVIKGAAGVELVDAIRSVATGQSYICVNLGQAGLRDLTRPEVASVTSLSVREREVLKGIAQGFTHREIAARLQLSAKTVETYRTRLQNKLGANTRVDLVTYALRVGLLAADPPGD